MNSIDKKKLNSHYRITDQERPAVLESIKRIFEGDYRRYCNGIATKAENILRKDYVDLIEWAKHKIILGLHVIFNESDNLIFKNYESEAWIFLRFFSLSYERADSVLKNKLRGQFVNGIKTDHGFPALFLELNILQTFLSLGHAAELISEDDAPDILLRSDFGDIYVECKCMSIKSKPPIPEGADIFLGKLMSKCLEATPEGERRLLTMTYHGPRDEKLRNIEASAQEALEKIVMGREFSNRFWNCKLELLPFGIGVGECEKAISDRKYVMPTALEGCFLFGTSVGYAVVKSVHTHRLERAIENLIVDALKQLPSSGLRFICIQVLGSFGHSQIMNHWRTLIHESVAPGSGAGRKIEKENKKENGFAGVNFISDFYVNKYEDAVGIDYVSIIHGGIGNGLVDLMNYGIYKRPVTSIGTY
ncbi:MULTISPECIES: hypothetical protein [unclassified Duganella]|uniref:hypothetical protein n=1 Tax=unclassified Duganella TaxID=2636909 RepID=UPI000881C126|nr:MULTISPECIES: hypothetical protein [unclassified Duganella]SDH56837.1 hypothetical protein SAMN05216320_115119 [Duganella sp. OV458]SDK66655.1 hypothetical protein SAMN05428973_1159 [Duganella sp. OV510]